MSEHEEDTSAHVEDDDREDLELNDDDADGVRGGASFLKIDGVDGESSDHGHK